MRMTEIGASRSLSVCSWNGSSCPIVFSNESRDGGSVVSDIDAVGCLRSLRAHWALDGVSWVRSGSVEIAVGQGPHATESAPSSAPSLGRRSRSGARFDLLFRLPRY